MQDRKKLFILGGVLVLLALVAGYMYLGGGGDNKPVEASAQKAAEIEAAQQAERAKLPPVPEPPPATATRRGAITPGGK